jgi:hypothetical protein
MGELANGISNMPPALPRKDAPWPRAPAPLHRPLPKFLPARVARVQTPFLLKSSPTVDLWRLLSPSSSAAPDPAPLRPSTHQSLALGPSKSAPTRPLPSHLVILLPHYPANTLHSPPPLPPPSHTHHTPSAHTHTPHLAPHSPPHFHRSHRSPSPTSFPHLLTHTPHSHPFHTSHPHKSVTPQHHKNTTHTFILAPLPPTYKYC